MSAAELERPCRRQVGASQSLRPGVWLAAGRIAPLRCGVCDEDEKGGISAVALAGRIGESAGFET